MVRVALERIVLSEQSNVDYAVIASFTDLDGRVVSLAFDGRYERSDFSKTHHRASYSPHKDYPLIDGYNKQQTEIAPLQIIRNLRDALVNLNLGD